MRLLRWGAFLALLTAVAGWALSAPARAPETHAALTGDPEAGRLSFATAGCASCHVDPEAPAEADALPLLSGGERFETAYGVFVSPNISPSPQGIGDWTDAELIHAMAAGVSPEGRHYYPAFPYGSYAKADPQDLADIAAYLRTLPASDRESAPHELTFPYSIARAVGLWKRLYLSPDWVLGTADTPEIERGRYLVESLGHCAECHTPRDALGGLDQTRWMAGAPNPSGEGRIPNITPAVLTWSEADIVAYLDTGFTPDFDVAGGTMAAVVKNTAQLPASDREAIAAYLKAIPGVE
jgi:mono/diheme cytochrome c family protein